MEILNEKLTVKTIAKAELEAETTSIEAGVKIYLYYCEKKDEYSIHTIATPFAPIFAGGYTPKCIGVFENGIKIFDSW